ncbi:MAG TPA: cytochrome c [Gemmataceae bacterium]|nr:cytochrome c [Gemmataceae bacterium]
MKQTIVMLLLFATASVVGAQETKTPTFNKDVAPILFNQCASCHRPGEAAPFPLLNYQDAKKRARLIAKVTQSKQMPPWKAANGDVAFRNERRLSDAEIGTLQQWFAAGAPEGNAKDLPPAPTFVGDWPLGKPDLVVKMPKAYRVPAEGRDIYRNFAVALSLKEDKWVRAVDFRPSAPSVVHHSLFFLDTTGTAAKKERDSGEVGSKGGMSGLSNLFTKGKGGLGALGGLGGLGGAQSTPGLGGWALGAQARALPDGLAYRVPKGSDLILSTHFHPSGKAEDEASTIALYFTDKAPTQRFTGLQIPMAFGIAAGINIPPGKKDYAIEDSFVLPVDVKGFGISAHAHYIGKEMKMTATLPDGKVKTLLHIPDWDFGWQEQYQFKDFYTLPKGTKLHVRITYDNSAENPNNPTSPPRRVRWGKESTDEMGSITLQVVAAQESDFPRLQEGYRKHMRDGLLKKLGNGAN